MQQQTQKYKIDKCIQMQIKLNFLFRKIMVCIRFSTLSE